MKPLLSWRIYVTLGEEDRLQEGLVIICGTMEQNIHHSSRFGRHKQETVQLYGGGFVPSFGAEKEPYVQYCWT